MNATAIRAALLTALLTVSLAAPGKADPGVTANV